MANWHRLTALAARAADRHFSESVRLSFLDGGLVDDSRPPLDLRAQLHLPGERDIVPARASASFTTQVVGNSGLLIIYKASLTEQLRQGDLVRASDRDGQPWFEVNAVDESVDQVIAQISPIGRSRAV